MNSENEVARKFSVTVDDSVNASYITLSGAGVTRTVKVTSSCLVDLDSEDRVVGIELLDFPRG
ncbi:hypothetical protein GCM10027595_01730 [Corynebacterium nasicanis]